MKYLKNNIALVFVLLLAAACRFYDFASWSLTNDELSALIRTRYNSFSDLINIGVKQDFHPAGVQIFLYYWIKLFGDSVASIRFPFVVSGIIAVALIYKIGEQWFNKTIAFLTASTYAVLSFSILYNQLARPYSFGITFCLLAVWAWDKALVHRDTTKKYPGLTLSFLASAAALYTHYICAIFLLLLNLAAVIHFWYEKEHRISKLLHYLGVNILAVLVFLPHLPITLHQFSAEGGGIGWLGKPDTTYIWSFIYRVFNHSPLLIIIMVIAFFYGIITSEQQYPNILQLISAGWFIITFLFLYNYSVYISPLMQDSALLFCFPFFLLYLFSYYKEYTRLFNRLIITIVLSTTLYSTIYTESFFVKKPFALFKDLAETTQRWDKQYGVQNVGKSFNLIAPDYIQYYFNQLQHKPDFYFFRGDSVHHLGVLTQKVELSNTPFYVYGWSNIYNPPEAEDIIRRKYPFIIDSTSWFNCGIRLYGLTKNGEERKKVFYSKLNFSSIPGSWNVDTTRIKKDSLPYFEVNTNTEFSCTFKKTVSEIFTGGSNRVIITAHCTFLEGNKAHLVAQFSTAKDSVYDWRSATSESFISKTNMPGVISITRTLPEKAGANDFLAVYFWNPDKSKFIIRSMEVVVFEE